MLLFFVNEFGSFFKQIILVCGNLLLKLNIRVQLLVNYLFFWKHICRLIPFMRLCMKKVVGNEQDTLFWLDNYYNDFALSVQFPILYSKAKTVDSLILAQVWNDGNVKILLTRGASLELRKEKGDLLAFLITLQLNSSTSDAVFLGFIIYWYFYGSFYVFIFKFLWDQNFFGWFSLEIDNST
jgi:hypothetical protein